MYVPCGIHPGPLIAVIAISDIRDAARDGARAAAQHRSVVPAVRASLHSWVGLKGIDSCGQGCVRVRGQMPLGVPGMVELVQIPISGQATFRVSEAPAWR